MQVKTGNLDYLILIFIFIFIKITIMFSAYKLIYKNQDMLNVNKGIESKLS